MCVIYKSNKWNTQSDFCNSTEIIKENVSLQG